MTLMSFFETLKDRKIRLTLDDKENIRVVGQRDKLDQALLNELKEKKAAIVEWLREEKTLSRPRIGVFARHTNELPLSFAQQRLWFIDQLGGSVQYNMPGAMQVQGRLDEEVAEGALRRII
ncbi:MAG TPA: hypothetical protein VFL79_04780, partial [Terriglobia bacterium]|nr:hypothetical protein [Terriglobia bacterium]